MHENTKLYEQAFMDYFIGNRDARKRVHRQRKIRNLVRSKMGIILIMQRLFN